jgi:hypothetical protein
VPLHRQQRQPQRSGAATDQFTAGS